MDTTFVTLSNIHRDVRFVSYEMYAKVEDALEPCYCDDLTEDYREK